MILANRVPLSECEWEGGDYIIGANQAGKCACSLLNCISVTDDSESNEHYKLIATGLDRSSMHTPNLTRFQHSYVEKCGFLTRGVNAIVVSTARKRFGSQKSIFTQRNDVRTSVQTVAKMCCLVQRAIFIVIKL